jgi:hypothetical protein
MQKEKKMTTTKNLKQLEEFAFYESGLSADGCFQKLDAYTIEAIERYGRILVDKQKENFIEGFQGSCYCCEPVGILNQQLEEIARKLYGVVLHLNAVSQDKSIVVVGESLYNETTDAIKMYEKYNANS